MELVAGGVEKNAGERQSGFVPAPGTLLILLRLADRAPEEQGEQGVFGHMSGLAKKMMDEFDVRLRNLRKQPVQQRFKQRGGMLVRMGVGGRGKNQNHPHDWWQPVFKQVSQFRHAE